MSENLLVPYAAMPLPACVGAIVFAPHADDEVFGCGATLALHAAAGAAITVIVLTDGVARAATDVAEEMAVREAESKAAAAHLGLPAPIFWRLPDRGLAYGGALVERLIETIATSGADLVYAPSLFEVHPDHRVTAMAALEAVRRLGGERRIAFYEVGAPGRPNALIDITSVLEKKRAAMRCFVSQLRHQRYDEQIEALNRYRAYTLPREVEAVEAFELVDSQSLRHGAWLEILASEYRRRQTLGLPVLGGRDLPLVSILIRSTGRATLAEALDSLAVQTYPNIEVVLVDAGGNSLSADLAAGNVRLIATGQPLSRSQAANAALAAARGAWLLFLDDDDYLAPDHVSRLVEAVSRDARLIAAYSDVVCVDAARQPIGKRFGRPFDHSLLLARNFMPIHAVLFSHAAVEAGCRFDERLDVLEDWDFWLQVAQLGEMRHVAGETAYYRIHAGGGWGVSDQAEKARVATIYVHDKWRHLLQGAQLFELMETVRRADDQLQAESQRQQAAQAHWQAVEDRLRGEDERLRTEKARLQQEDRHRQAALDEVLARADLLERELRCRNDQLAEAHALMQRRDSEYEARVHALAGRIAVLEQEKQQASDASGQELMRLRHELAAVAAERAALLASRSWRITAPLRWLNRRLTATPALPQSGSSAEECSRPALVEATAPAIAAPAVVDAKAEFRASRRRILDAFLQGDQRLLLPRSETPTLSILLVLFNQAELTLACLQALADDMGGLDCEIIVVDNASSDDTTLLLQRVDGLNVWRNDENVGFLRAVNQAAARARGEYLLLLNNDAEVLPGSLRQAVAHMSVDASIGALGGRIVLLDGRLQEAGNIVWRDGSCLGYGRGDDPEAPAYRFERDVDYCSGAFLLTRTALFRELGGFDEAYVPAYYEETDYCLRLWQRGLRVLFDPLVVVRHFEFGSQERPEAAIRLQERNRATFVARHGAYLAQKPLPAPEAIERARQVLPSGARRILFVDDRVPYPSLGSGYPRSAAILQTLVAAGHAVTFYPMTFPQDDRARIRASFSATVADRVEFMLDHGIEGLARFAAARRDAFDVVFVSRPHNMQFLQPFLGEETGRLGKIPVVYDAEALFALRDFRKAAVLGEALDPVAAWRRLEDELALARAADRVTAVSAAEAQRFAVAGCADVRIIGHAVEPEPTLRAFDEREGLLFIGALDDDGSPNVDSVLWFVREVLPIFHTLLDAEPPLVLAGRANHPAIQALQGEKVRVLGRVEDLTPLYDRCRVFVAPTRFAGGIPHKAHEAAAHGLPMVATSLIAGQLGWSEELLVADAPLQFARQCAALYAQTDLWQTLRARALARVARDCDADRLRQAVLTAVDIAVPAAAGPERQR